MLSIPACCRWGQPRPLVATPSWLARMRVKDPEQAKKIRSCGKTLRPAPGYGRVFSEMDPDNSVPRRARRSETKTSGGSWVAGWRGPCRRERLPAQDSTTRQGEREFGQCDRSTASLRSTRFTYQSLLHETASPTPCRPAPSLSFDRLPQSPGRV